MDVKVKGTSIRSRPEFLQQRCGDEDREGVLAGLDADDRGASDLCAYGVRWRAG